MTTAWWGGGLEHGAVVDEAMRLGASQDPDELRQAIDVIAALDPLVVVEIGCDRGGTLFAWLSVCAVVYGITTADNSYETGGSGEPLEAHGAVVRVGDSHDPASRAWLLDELACDDNPTVAHQIDALVIDGDHHVAGVLQDLAMYGPLVRPGGVILLHDISFTPDERAEVWKVWPALQDSYTTTEIHNPAGGYGWGVIHVQPGDEFEIKEGSLDG